jgi:hypothetical protein
VLLQTTFYVCLGILPASLLLYQAVQPGKDGEPVAITKWLHSFWYMQEEWTQRNALHTKAVEEAGFDRTLFFHADRKPFTDLKYPEYAPAVRYQNRKIVSS